MTSAQLPSSRPFFGNAALITRAQAEHILAAVDAGNPKTKKPRVRELDTFILSGLLFTPEGVQWHGDSHDNCYRAGPQRATRERAFY